MRGDVVRQGHLGHVAHVLNIEIKINLNDNPINNVISTIIKNHLHKVFPAVAVGGRHHRQQAEEDGGPGGQVGRQHIVHVHTTLRIKLKFSR